MICNTKEVNSVKQIFYIGIILGLLLPSRAILASDTTEIQDQQLPVVNLPIINTNVTYTATIEPYNHDQHKMQVLQLLQENPRELGYEGIYDSEQWAALNSSQEHCNVLIHNGNAIGFILFTKLFGIEGHIRALAISKQYRNKGFGKILLDNAIATLKANDVQCIVASVYEDCIDSSQFWIKQGFQMMKDPETGNPLTIADRDLLDPASAKNARMMNGYVLKI